ncbi:DUF169 domain-containing protein [Desulfotalea psychrophila]|uniref:Uncharacterized protein n=1 Tax=Desulfotalea psychrophila (strain LSv54 / DSM 12343) TaxID=177439 RepID=Q6AP20_DESPS|nr:DUF169 domain-containing protein [Desulfotalea psychrophila]CAG35904.1 hypothetical protein DP1175 [Desulfotalea psychrophila LSv54]
MKNTNVWKMTTALDLQHRIVGLHFLDFQEDYDNCKAEPAALKGPYCYQVRQALDGKHFKVDKNLVTCDYARAAIGLEKPDISMREGRSFDYCGLAESRAIGKSIADAMMYIDQDIFGVELGPLEEMEHADLVIMVDYAHTMMRIMQGYTYKYGAPKNLSFYGNQAMCSDMTSKVFHTNDINLSLMCNGTRRYGKFDKGELAVSLPINMFDPLSDGIIETINAVQSVPEKKRLIKTLEHSNRPGCEENSAVGKTDPESLAQRPRTNDAPDFAGRSGKRNSLGLEIDTRYNYGKGLLAYDNHVLDLRKKGDNGL